MICLFISVPDRVVPFRLCWTNNKAKRQMVLSEVFTGSQKEIKWSTLYCPIKIAIDSSAFYSLALHLALIFLFSFSNNIVCRDKLKCYCSTTTTKKPVIGLTSNGLFFFVLNLYVSAFVCTFVIKSTIKSAGKLKMVKRFSMFKINFLPHDNNWTSF